MLDWSCDGKERYASRDRAQGVLDRMHRRSQVKGRRQQGKLEVYGCRACGGWHLGHNIRRK